MSATTVPGIMPGLALWDGHIGLACLSVWHLNNWCPRFIVTKNSYQERSVRLTLLIKSVWNFNVHPIFNWKQPDVLGQTRDTKPCKYLQDVQLLLWKILSPFLTHPQSFRTWRYQRCCYLIVCTKRCIVKDLTAVLGWLNGLCELCGGTLSIMQGMTALPLFPNKHYF